MDDKDLKIQALLEALGTNARNYENKIADLRVRLTTLEQTINDLQSNPIIQEDTSGGKPVQEHNLDE